MPAVKVEKLTEKETKNVEDSKTIRQRVQKARDRQTKRFANTSITANTDMTNKNIKIFCPLSDECLNALRMAINTLHLSGRSYHRMIKLSRTIADLEEAEEIKPNHIAEALQYRPKMEEMRI
ncbi:MAG TPA: hypothetical protein VMR41_02205 [Patescibacteria group bacterium]|nr:hypothetical protein [Patescibacteria group bacterium]